MFPHVSVPLCGERFRVTYEIWGDFKQVENRAKAICIEQTVEFPAELLPDGDIPLRIVGQIEDIDISDCAILQGSDIKGNYLEQSAGDVQNQSKEQSSVDVTISYPIEITGLELTQLLNVVFGNSSLQPGIKVKGLWLSPRLLAAFKGPRFGIAGLRKKLGIAHRPLICTALKPMGYSAHQLSELAYNFALGGIDLIKDDHGLSDQPFCPFCERVQLCAEAVERANRITGHRCLYLPNITGPAHKISDWARFARSAGAGALLYAPGLGGFDVMRWLSEDDALDLPIFCHPALLGSFVSSHQQGISHDVLFGKLARLAGADASIFPNYGGRFSFSEQQCRQIANGCRDAFGHLAAIWPAPGGGMQLNRIAEIYQFYGDDLIYLIGGDLHRPPNDLVANSRRFVQMVEQVCKA